MLSFLPGPLKGILSLPLYILNTVFWFIPLLTFALLKWLIPIAFIRTGLSIILDGIASCWIGVNTGIQWLFLSYKLELDSSVQTTTKQRYLVISNHQSWVDIMLLQRIFHGRIPFLKFFLKQELIYVPFLGLAWWALDFPFMQRHSKSAIRKNPKLAGKDIETTRKACEKFKHIPVSIMNFVEGTRFTQAKHDRQRSPYQHLLKPKAGGIAFVLSSMGDKMDCILDVSIAYGGEPPTFWQYICGSLQQVAIQVKAIPIDGELVGNYADDKAFRVTFQRRMNEIWAEKDQWLAAEKKRMR